MYDWCKTRANAHSSLHDNSLLIKVQNIYCFIIQRWLERRSVSVYNFWTVTDTVQTVLQLCFGSSLTESSPRFSFFSILSVYFVVFFSLHISTLPKPKNAPTGQTLGKKKKKLSGASAISQCLSPGSSPPLEVSAAAPLSSPATRSDLYEPQHC